MACDFYVEWCSTTQPCDIDSTNLNIKLKQYEIVENKTKRRKKILHLWYRKVPFSKNLPKCYGNPSLSLLVYKLGIFPQKNYFSNEWWRRKWFQVYILKLHMAGRRQTPWGLCSHFININKHCLGDVSTSTQMLLDQRR